MTSRDFCYWLQGMFELSDPKSLSKEQTSLIKKHLHMVFAHEIDPSMPNPKLDQIHNAISVFDSNPHIQGTFNKEDITKIQEQYDHHIDNNTLIKC